MKKKSESFSSPLFACCLFFESIAQRNASFSLLVFSRRCLAGAAALSAATPFKVAGRDGEAAPRRKGEKNLPSSASEREGRDSRLSLSPLSLSMKNAARAGGKGGAGDSTMKKKNFALRPRVLRLKKSVTTNKETELSPPPPARSRLLDR